MDPASIPRATLPPRAVIAAYAVHRLDPGEVLTASFESNNVLLRSRAIKAVWQLGRDDLVPNIRAAYSDQDVHCRFSACWAGALLVNDPDAIAGLRELAETGARYPDRAVQLAGGHRVGDDARRTLLRVPSASVQAASVAGICVGAGPLDNKAVFIFLGGLRTRSAERAFQHRPRSTVVFQRVPASENHDGT